MSTYRCHPRQQPYTYEEDHLDAPSDPALINNTTQTALNTTSTLHKSLLVSTTRCLAYLEIGPGSNSQNPFTFVIGDWGKRIVIYLTYRVQTQPHGRQRTLPMSPEVCLG